MLGMPDVNDVTGVSFLSIDSLLYHDTNILSKIIIMALYDNRHWLLSHIKNSFISSDDTGICEMVMLGEDIPRSLSHATKVCCYPGADQSEGEDELDVLSHSLDILADIEFGVRQRSNTTQRLEKMDNEHEKGEKVKFIKWENNTGYDPSDFQRKDFRKKTKDKTHSNQSLLVKRLESYPTVFKNPFLEYAKFDGDAQVGVPTRKYGIFMMMLPPADRNFPLHVVVIASARVQDLIGLICWKYTLEHGEMSLGDSAVENYGLYIAEDDGEVDWDFPCLDPRETISKFGFSFLALVECKEKVARHDSTSKERKEGLNDVGVSEHRLRIKGIPKDEDMQRMKGHMTAMEAPLYQSYRVYTVSKVRSKTEIQLGVSGEKIEIDPVMPQRVGAKFWNRQKAVSYDIDSIAACELVDSKTNNRGTLRLTYYSPQSGADQENTSHSHVLISHFKHYDFETELTTAEEIVQKINNILDLTTPIRRQEYLDLKESRPQKKKIFRLGQKP